ncbi:hypothetical protein TWF788_010947 [Orbilia oligospora]|uniref:Uncharacterized protein n=1 Tax=Orbilia oligospora TaxID=2813651 RepID=A0A7C8KCD3_ORBOL|nr:hypothetical protein TWF788_010947 [Orbilia oligospora]
MRVSFPAEFRETVVLAASIWSASLARTARGQVTATETNSTSVILYTTVQPTWTITSSCQPGNVNSPWLPLCNQVTWASINGIGSPANDFDSSSPGETGPLQPVGQSAGLGSQPGENQDLGDTASPTDGILSQASSAAKLAQSNTLNSNQGDTTGTSGTSATIYPSPFPIGGRGRLRNLAVELSPGGMVIFKEASDSPQEFINDESGYIRPVSNPDMVLYIHLDKETDSNQRDGDRTPNNTVLHNVRAKTQASTDSYDIENTFTVREGGIQLRGTSDHAEYRFYTGDYEDDDQEYQDRVLKLLAAPVGQLINFEEYKVEEVILLPFVIRFAAAKFGGADDETTEGEEGTGAESIEAAKSISELNNIITSSSLIPFCSEYLSHVTLLHTETAAHRLVHSESTSIPIAPETSNEIGAVSTTTVTLQSGITTKPWPAITFSPDETQPGEIHYGSDTNVYSEGEITILQKRSLPQYLNRDFDIPKALSIYNPSQISLGCSEVIYKLHHSTTTGQRSTHTSGMTVVVISESTFTRQINHIETVTTTVPSITITPTLMSGRILIYGRGEYSTSPGRLSANYLAPTTVHTSMTNPTVVAELEGGSEPIKSLGVGDFALVPEEEIDGYFLSFVIFWVEEDGRIMIDRVYANKDSEVEYINGWEFIWCYDRPSTLWNYNTAKKYRDEGGQNSELTGISRRRDDQPDGCTPQTLSFEKLDGETAANDIIYADVLKREAHADIKDTNVENT